MCEQPSDVGIADGLRRWPGTLMGVGLLNGLINVSIATALVTLLLLHVGIASNLNVLALAALIILTSCSSLATERCDCTAEQRRLADW